MTDILLRIFLFDVLLKVEGQIPLKNIRKESGIMTANKEIRAGYHCDKSAELVDVLHAISVVSKRLAGRIVSLEYKRAGKLISDKAEWRSDDGEI